ncbi:MAG: tRNA (adenosine(37)-N6)-dimethylallyltransferase MiaA [Verrucomicrobiales bacterium]|nr:tRNA (adenosine(37)-N6)-dimethylallyltransferase MiaA [Verrucomicrobiota bacterium JB025]
MAGEGRQFNCVVVCGPTASGKTWLGVRLAEWLGGEVLSADSRQVYRGMDIGTGKDLAEYELEGGRIPHHLIDMVDPREVYSLWDYQRDFYAAFRDVRERGRMPVVVGGTGLYLEAVLKHYEIPDVPEDAELRRELDGWTVEKLLGTLGELDPELLEKTDVSSKKRIVRSVEIAMHGRDHEVRWGHGEVPEISPLILAVGFPRPELKERIRRRLEERLDEGMIGEVERLSAAGVTRERLDLFGMEYGQIARLLAGEVSRERMVEDLFHAICRLAKRQMTWFRGMERRGLPVTWLEGPDFGKACEVIRGGG